MNRPLFSILTTSFRHGPLLGAWCKSIARQSYGNIEVIFIDDCSRDMKKFRRQCIPILEKKNIAVKYLRNEENLGCASSYKLALSMASGDFFGVVDADDCLKPYAVDDIVTLYESNPDIGWIYTQFDWCNADLKRRRTGFCRPPLTGKSILESELSGSVRHCYSHWRTFSRRVPDLESIFEDGRRVSVDKYMGYRLEELSPGMYYDRVCYSYRGGVDGCVTKTHDSLGQWRRVRKQAKKRREEQEIDTHSVVFQHSLSK